jgi:hypothetical protein
MFQIFYLSRRVLQVFCLDVTKVDLDILPVRLMVSVTAADADADADLLREKNTTE